MEESAHSGARIVSASPSRWGKDGRGARLHSFQSLKLRADGPRPVRPQRVCTVSVCVSLVCLHPRLLECVETVPVSDNNY